MGKKIQLPSWHLILEDLRSLSMNEVCLKYGIKRHALRKRLNKECPNHIIIQDKKYTLFDKIDNEISAYWLGYLYADGNVHINFRKNLYKVALGSNDIEHLKLFHKAIGAKNKIVIYKNHGKSSVCSRILCDRLISLGCVPRKSLTLQFPNFNQVPENLLSHFIRGYFDGDGCIFLAKSYVKRAAIFISSDIFLNNLVKFLNQKINLSNITIHKIKNNKAFRVCYSSKNDLKLLFDYLYRDATIYLNRKYKKYSEVIQSINLKEI